MPVTSPALPLLPTSLHGSRVKQVPRAMGLASSSDPEMGPNRRAESTRNAGLREVGDGKAPVSQQARQQLAECRAGGAPEAPLCWLGSGWLTRDPERLQSGHVTMALDLHGWGPVHLSSLRPGLPPPQTQIHLPDAAGAERADLARQVPTQKTLEETLIV